MVKNVYVPYKVLHPSIEGALRQQNVHATYVRMDDEQSYWRFLCERWTDGQTFFLVEHDILPWPGALKVLADCPHSWCTLPYLTTGYMNPRCLGCTKITTEFIAKYPDLPQNFTDHGWQRLDMQLLDAVKPREPHRHHPPVLHMSAGKWGEGNLDQSLAHWAAAEARRHETLLLTDEVYRSNFAIWCLEQAIPDAR